MKLSKRFIFLGVLIIILCSLLLTACDSRAKKLSIVSLTSGEEYVLPLKPKTIINGGLFQTFTLEKTPTEICEILNEKHYNCSVFNNNFILIKDPLENSRINYMIIAKLHDENRFMFMSSVAFDGNSPYLFPVHLTNITASDLESGIIYSFMPNTEYEITGNFEDVKSFYLDSGLFNIEENENVLTICNKANLPTSYLSKESFTVIVNVGEFEKTKITLQVETN